MYLGLDLGTSSLKGVIVSESGEVIASKTHALDISRPHAGWSEQNPADWIDAAKIVLRGLRRKLPKVRAVGLAGQMHGATCLDKAGRAIRPCLLWNDMRAHAEAEKLDTQDDLKAIFGNITFAGFTAPKLLWMREHEPENYAQIAKVVLPKDYLRYWLTNAFISEMSDASGTAWLDIQRRDWSDDLLNASGLSRAQMPKLIEGSEASGIIQHGVAQAFGFANRVVVAGGAGDNAASAIGLDIISAQKAFISLGTSGVVFAASDKFRPNPASALHAFAHAIPNTWHQMGVTLSATDCVNWLARQLGERPTELTNMGAMQSPTPELFLPFLGGERTPYNSAKLRASFRNLGHDTDRNALVRAVLEGVSFSLKECFDLMEKSQGSIDDILVVGGGAQSDDWLSLLATIFGKTIRRPHAAEHAAAIGAARLGALAIDEDFEIASHATHFDPHLYSDAYQAKYAQYLHAIQSDIKHA